MILPGPATAATMTLAGAPVAFAVAPGGHSGQAYRVTEAFPSPAIDGAARSAPQCLAPSEGLPRRLMPRHGCYLRVSVGPVGIEPTTRGLKVPART
ncbi:MAG: hypothetical protein JWR70_230 [Modestobacter sp.]|nr:hypothetical protein [Modestobacter sp.]